MFKNNLIALSFTLLSSLAQAGENNDRVNVLSIQIDEDFNPTAESIPTTESIPTAESIPTTESIPTAESTSSWTSYTIGAGVVALASAIVGYILWRNPQHRLQAGRINGDQRLAEQNIAMGMVRVNRLRNRNK